MSTTLSDTELPVQLLKAAVFANQDGLPRSTQLGPGAGVGTASWIEPKYNPVDWSDMLGKSSRLNRAIRSIARNTVGLGFDVIPLKEWADLTDADKRAFEQERETALTLLGNPNYSMESLPEILEKYKIDEESTGDGWLEVPEDRAGRPSSIFHAPSKTMRIARAGDHFVQVRGGGTQVRHFRSFGDERSLDPATGKEKDLPWDERATVMLHHKLFTPDDDFYGAPRFVPAAIAIANQLKGQMWNYHFLDNSALLPYAVIVEGGNLTSESRSSITEFIAREGKGVKNAGRVLLLEPEMSAVNPTQRDQVKIKLEKIAVGITDDGSFLKLREADNEEIREVLGWPKILLGTFTDANKANAVIALRITVQQEIEPEIVRVEYMLNRAIIQKLGLKACRLRLRRPKILDPLQDASLVSKLIKAFSVNDLRAVVSDLRGKRLPPLDDPMAHQPLAFFNSPQMLTMAEDMAEQVVQFTKELTEDAPELSLVSTKMDDVANKRPLNGVEVVQ